MDLRASSKFQEQLEADRRSSRRFHIIMSCCFGLFFAALIGFGVYAFKTGENAHRRFMTQCMEDHKEYECTAMWRAGSSEAPTIMLVPSGRSPG